MFSLGPAAEERLAVWMLEHVTVSTVEHPSPGFVEGAVIASIVAPLNDRFAHHEPYWRSTGRPRRKDRVRVWVLASRMPRHCWHGAARAPLGSLAHTRPSCRRRRLA